MFDERYTDAQKVFLEKVGFKAGYFPRYHKSKLKMMGAHKVCDFLGQRFFLGLPNVMYRDSFSYQADGDQVTFENTLFTTGREMVVYPVESYASNIEVYNVETETYESIGWEEKDHVSWDYVSDTEYYARGYADFITLEYDHTDGIWSFDSLKFLRAKYSPEINFSRDDSGYHYTIEINGVAKRSITLSDYRDDVDMWNCDNGERMIFGHMQALHNFVKDLEAEMSKRKIGSKFSDIYQKVVSGEMTEEEFLKAIV